MGKHVAAEAVDTGPPVDGRRARRERGRAAVLDAVFALAEEGKIPLTAESVAERSGVSIASIFRYFDGLDDLQYRTYERFRDRYAPLLEPVTGDREQRIAGLVERRIALYEQAGAMMTLGRLRALEHRPLLEASTETKAALAAQVRATLAPELDGASPGRAAELVAVVDALTSAEAWDVLHRTHARSRTQIARTWRRALAVLIDDWATTSTTSPADQCRDDRPEGER